MDCVSEHGSLLPKQDIDLRRTSFIEFSLKDVPILVLICWSFRYVLSRFPVYQWNSVAGLMYSTLLKYEALK